MTGQDGMGRDGMVCEVNRKQESISQVRNANASNSARLSRHFIG